MTATLQLYICQNDTQMANVIDHQGNTSQTQSELWPYSSKNSFYFKKSIQDVQKIEPVTLLAGCVAIMENRVRVLKELKVDLLCRVNQQY